MVHNMVLHHDPNSDTYKLQFDPDTKYVIIPQNTERNISQVKELCSGIGGIGQGLRFAGFEILASMDKNPYMCETLRRNGQVGVIQGDVLAADDRHSLHLTPGPVRGLYASGFPCQPYSSQGDQRGFQDERAKPFQGILQAAWEHQVAGLLLENVPGAAQAEPVQSGLQRLAWSLGCDVIQTVLQLDNAWPCRRTRWWALLVPQEYVIHSIPDLPFDQNLRRIGQLLPHWPVWSEAEERQLLLTEAELDMMQDPRYGSDPRWLQDDKPCPCILHAYSNFAGPCPCGCRSSPLSQQRLLRDGLRGFYVLSKVFQRPRWLHPREAAVLCGLDPFGSFAESLKGGLSQVGQCASPIQSSWIGSHLRQAVDMHAPDPQQVLCLHKMALLRQLHGLAPTFPHQDHATLVLQSEDTFRSITVDPTSTAGELIEAESKLLGPDRRVALQDAFGALPKNYKLIAGAIQGHFRMKITERPIRSDLADRTCDLSVVDAVTGQVRTCQCQALTFLFEILEKHGIILQPGQHLVDATGMIWTQDRRITRDTTLLLMPLQGAGPGHFQGLNNDTLDDTAHRLLDTSESLEQFFWLDTLAMTMSFHDPASPAVPRWLELLHAGQLWSAFVTDGHWVLLHAMVDHQTLYLTAWDGLPPNYEAKLTTLGAYWQAHLGLEDFQVTLKYSFKQQHAATCGTVALLHLGLHLGLWTTDTAPDEAIWHHKLSKKPHSGSFGACGSPTTQPQDLGLSHQVIDLIAKRLQCLSPLAERSFWMPSALATWLHDDHSQQHLWHWCVGALYGTVRSCIAVNDHWLYLAFTVDGDLLLLQCWDGYDHSYYEQIFAFAQFIQRRLHIRTLSVEYLTNFTQTHSATCGTVALLHLGRDLRIWDETSAPDQIEWHCYLLTRFDQQGLRARGRDDEAPPEALLWSLRDLLQQHGVPADRAEERALAAINKIGRGKIQTAMASKNPWNHLKALGSAPKVNFLFVKPDELQQQIRLRAQTKYRASTSNRKQPAKGQVVPVVLDPAQLQLLPGTFQQEDGSDISQIQMDAVAAERTGLAFGSLSSVAPYLKTDQPISTGALAVLTVEPVPHESQGLLTVENIRFPALYKPTAEPVLIDGSLLQLGDDSVMRVPAEDMPPISKLDTVTFKITVWKDQWPAPWEPFTKAPVRALLERTPRLVLCRGDRCGPQCPKYHNDVDAPDIDAVLQDLWGRSWSTQRGRKIGAEEADQFQVLIRIPVACADGLQQRSGADGVYYEKRSTDGRKPDDSTSIIWLPGANFADAMHQVRTHDRSICLVRWNGRYGIRARTADAENLHSTLEVDSQYSDVAVAAVYEARPLPFGIQRSGVVALIKQWGWSARPLQPARGDQHGRAWLIGAEAPPPSMVLPTSDGDVVLTLHRKPAVARAPLAVLSSHKTLTHLKKDHSQTLQQQADNAPGPSNPWSKYNENKAISNQQADKENVIPWAGPDPWGGFNPPAKTMEVDEAAVLRPQKIQQIQASVQDHVKEAHEERFQRLETDITQIRQQQDKFESWFQDAGKATSTLQSQVGSLTNQLLETKNEIHQQVGTLTQQMGENRQGITDMGARIEQGFANLQDLLRERHFHEKVAVPANPGVHQWFKSYFLRWVRGIAQAGEHPGDDIVPDDGSSSDGQETPLDRALRQEHGDLSCLEGLGGDRLLKIFRPDPQGLGRSRLLRVRALPTTTLQALRRLILLHWPDLQQPPLWRLFEVHPTVRRSAHSRGGVETFVLAAQLDLRQQEVVVLLEYQDWDLHAGLYTGYLTPFVWPVTRPARDLFQWTGSQRCIQRPCAVQINGRVPFSDEDPFFSMGSFVYIMAPRQPAWLHHLMGNWLDATAPILPVPAGWADWVAQTMYADRFTDLDSSRQIAYNFQVAVTAMYHDLAAATQANQVQGRYLLTLAPSVPLRYMVPMPYDEHLFDLGYDHPRLLPYFLGELRDVRFFRYFWGWHFITFNPWVKELPLMPVDQVLAVRHPVPGDIFRQSRLTIMEILTQGPGRGTQSFQRGDLFLILLPLLVTRDQVLASCGMQEDCRDHDCLVQLDGRHVTERGEPHPVHEGSVLRLWFFPMEYQLLASPFTPVEDAPALPTSADHSPITQGYSPGRTPPFSSPDPSSSSTSPTEEPTALLLLLALCTGVVDTWITALSFRPKRCGSRGRLLQGLLWCLLPTLVTSHMASSPIEVHRFGEALHPGPTDVWIGTTNPSGVRGKEEVLADLPYGLWTVAETQLSAISMGPAARAIKTAGLRRQRALTVTCGAPMPLRARSRTVGQWAGVLTFTDLTIRPVLLKWPGDEYQLGRVQITQAWHGPYAILGASVYGFPKSPAWPKALPATRQLMDTVVQELGLSATGPRYIAGDFNHALEALPALQVLFDMGWRDLQHLAFERTGRAFTNTCKGATITDFVLISPELAPLFQRVDTWDAFADHAALAGCFSLPTWSPTQTVWTMPAKVPWEALDKQTWDLAAHQVGHHPEQSLQERFQQFSRDYEASFTGYIAAPGGKLPPAACGRGQRIAPETRPSACPLLKASRPGELKPAADTIGRTVQKWFQQLRRLQSMVHALRAAKQSLDAQLYRVSLWRAIRSARGFEDGWDAWWKQRPTRNVGLPLDFPTEVPALPLCEAIFEDFQHNYRRFESWHLRQRYKLLKLTFQEKRTRVFGALKTTTRTGLHYLVRTHSTTVRTVSADGAAMDLDEVAGLQLPATLSIGALHIFLESTDLSRVPLDPEWLVQAPQPALIRQHCVTPQAIQAELHRFWSPRWWQEQLPPESAWDPIIQFAQAYLPAQQMHYSPLSVEAWDEVISKFSARAARGPDGYDRLDVQYMPRAFKEELLDILQEGERTATWPQQLRPGFVQALPKREGACEADTHRPIIVYSILYRSWSSLRAKAILAHVHNLATEHQLGFMPGCEPADLWVLLQALLEGDHQRGTGLMGYVSDLRKAFETLPREPIKRLAVLLGIPGEIVNFWHAFLATTERRFVVHGETGPPVLSNVGYPEGCALSCAAMSLVGLTLHAYMRVYAPHCICLSFVDNLEIFAERFYHLQWGITCLETWIAMWRLELDAAKTYTWATTPGLRGTLQEYGHRVETAMKDLGAQMVYGCSHVIAEQRNRLQALDPLWPRLRAVPCPEPAKWMALQQAFWQRAFYGISICPISWSHLKTLRTEAMKALGYRRAGASPALRLFLLCPAQCDPGFFQVWTVFNTFLRIGQKHAALFDEWQHYMDHYMGKQTHGPFAKLLEQCSYLGWSISVPGFFDHYGVWHSMLSLSDKALYALLLDAWTWVVWGEVKHRKDMVGLHGIDRHVLLQAARQVPPHQQGLIRVLQDGTFQEPGQHAKYDLAQDSVCPLCHQADSMVHRLEECPALRSAWQASSLTPAVVAQWDYHKKIRCLPSANPWLGKFRAAQCGVDECIGSRPLSSASSEHCHLFTDGTCHGGSITDYALAAWAVVCPARDTWVRRGALSGLQQTIDRAELRAGLAAVEYAVIQASSATIWTDSTYFAAGCNRLLLDSSDLPETTNLDLWQDLRNLLAPRQLHLTVQHIPGHRMAPLHDQDVDDWSARWNARADLEASCAQRLHPPEVRRLHRELCRHHREEVRDLQRVQALHLALYDARAAALPSVVRSDPAEDDPGQLLEVDWECPPSRDPLEQVTADWISGPALEEVRLRFGVDFTKNFLLLLLDWAHSPDSYMTRFSFLELAILVGTWRPEWAPLPHPTRPNTWINSEMRAWAHHRELTVAQTVRLVKGFLHFLGLRHFDFAWYTGLNLLALGVHTPLEGVALRAPSQIGLKAKTALADFTSRRPIRTSNDLSRPVRSA
eukprot:Skav209660  [mRNA]  locus=scaffold2126:122984:134587:- [translate_table: standard]